MINAYTCPIRGKRKLSFLDKIDIAIHLLHALSIKTCEQHGLFKSLGDGFLKLYEEEQEFLVECIKKDKNWLRIKAEALDVANVALRIAIYAEEEYRK